MDRGASRSSLRFMPAASAITAIAQEHPARGGAERTAAKYKAMRRRGIRSRAVRAYCRCCRRDSVTEHSIDIAGGKLAYTATAGTFSLFDQSGERSAAIFYTAYVAKPRSAGTAR